MMYRLAASALRGDMQTYTTEHPRRVREATKNDTADATERSVRHIVNLRLELLLLRRRCCSGSVAPRRVLGGNADDLDASATGNVHCVDDVRVLHARHALHENDLLRPRIVNLLEPSRQPIASD